MPRLFWKMFFALWLSIMAFAVIVSWINQSVILQNFVEQPADAFNLNLNRFKVKLQRDLQTGDERRAKKTLRSLPRGLQNHIFLLDADGREIFGK